MKKRLLRVAAVAFVLAAGASRAALGAPPEAGARVQAAAVPQPPLTRDQIAQFLKTAKVIGHKGISRGVTNPARLTLSDGTLTHDAVFSRKQRNPSCSSRAAGPSSISWIVTVTARRQ